jgi:hypothetical protein
VLGRCFCFYSCWFDKPFVKKPKKSIPFPNLSVFLPPYTPFYGMVFERHHIGESTAFDEKQALAQLKKIK